MGQRIFWDVDTQEDFIDPAGKLCVSGAVGIVPNLQRLTEHARANGMRIVAHLDDHELRDDEISARPDYDSTFPPHCLRGTPGQEKISATRPREPLFIENRPYSLAVLQRIVTGHRGEIVIKKNRLDIFAQPNTNLLLEVLKPLHIVVYGVALDYCVRFAVEGFLARGDIAVSVVRDAVRAIDGQQGETLLRDWTRRGVDILTTEAVIGT